MYKHFIINDMYKVITKIKIKKQYHNGIHYDVINFQIANIFLKLVHKMIIKMKITNLKHLNRSFFP